jgi:hypothetical protein
MMIAAYSNNSLYITTFFLIHIILLRIVKILFEKIHLIINLLFKHKCFLMKLFYRRMVSIRHDDPTGRYRVSFTLPYRLNIKC